MRSVVARRIEQDRHLIEWHALRRLGLNASHDFNAFTRFAGPVLKLSVRHLAARLPKLWETEPQVPGPARFPACHAPQRRAATMAAQRILHFQTTRLNRSLRGIKPLDQRVLPLLAPGPPGWRSRRDPCHPALDAQASLDQLHSCVTLRASSRLQSEN